MRTVKRRSAPRAKRKPTLIDAIAYSVCEFANGSCVCRETAGECCEALRWRAAAIARRVADATEDELAVALPASSRAPVR